MTPQAAGGRWRAHLAKVTLGLVNAKFIEIRNGLHEGDQVIYAGYENLTEGAPVVPTQWGLSGPLALPPATGEVAAGGAYTCAMHPQVVQDHPGKCPICRMDLVPRNNGAAAGPSRASGAGGTK